MTLTRHNQSYHEVANNDCGEEEGDADVGGDEHAVPHGLYPLSTKDSKHNHETVHEVGKVPSGQIARPLFTHFIQNLSPHSDFSSNVGIGQLFAKNIYHLFG